MAQKGVTDAYDAAVKAQASSPAEAIRLYRDIALGNHPNDADSIKARHYTTPDGSLTSVKGQS